MAKCLVLPAHDSLPDAFNEPGDIGDPPPLSSTTTLLLSLMISNNILIDLLFSNKKRSFHLIFYVQNIFVLIKLMKFFPGIPLDLVWLFFLLILTFLDFILIFFLFTLQQKIYENSLSYTFLNDLGLWPLSYFDQPK